VIAKWRLDMMIRTTYPRKLTALAAAAMIMAILLAPAAAQSPSPLVPDRHLTPGATLPVTVADISQDGYTKTVRDVPARTKLRVFAEYGIVHPSRGQFEVDHLIPLELGGSNSIKNLWPESYRTRPWNAHIKDELENKLHEMVVSGRLDLRTAQQAIAQNWIAAYKKYFHASLPVLEGRARVLAKAVSPASPATKVWVNTRSGVFHLPGSRWYGRSKDGVFMTLDNAVKKGYRQAAAGR